MNQFGLDPELDEDIEYPPPSPQKKVLITVKLNFLQLSLIFSSQTIWIKIVNYFQFTNNMELNTEQNPDFSKIQDPNTDPD
jgi:hypothetical protein